MNRLFSMLRRFNRVAAALAGVAAFAAAHPSYAWPDKPIRVVIPFAAGGTTDMLGRLMAEGIAPILGQPVVVSNKGGAGGNLGAAEVARAPADGYTLLLGTPGTQIINGLVYKNPGYDPVKDFSSVVYMVRVANVVVTTPATGFRNMRDVIEAARAQPGKLNWGTPGVGSSGHLSLELIKQQAGLDITHVPYKGAGQARNDMLGGVIQLAGDNLPTALSAIRSGSLVALGVSSMAADPTLPEVQPIAATIPGYELSSWFVVMAPAGTPSDAIGKLNAAVNQWLEKPDTRARLADLAAVPIGGSPEDLAAHLRNEQQKYESLIKAAGISAQ